MIAGRWASYSPELCILGGVFLSGDLMKILVVEDEPLLALALAEEWLARATLSWVQPKQWRRGWI
jgi:hypothetical protein